MTGHDPYRAQTPTDAPLVEQEIAEGPVVVDVDLQNVELTFHPDGVELPRGLFPEDVLLGDVVVLHAVFSEGDDRAGDPSYADALAEVVEITDTTVRTARVDDGTEETDDDSETVTHRLAVELHVYEDAANPDGHEWSTLTVSADHFAAEAADAAYGRPAIEAVRPGDVVELVVADHEDLVAYPMVVVDVDAVVGSDGTEGGVVLADLQLVPPAPVHFVEVSVELLASVDPAATQWALPRHLVPAEAVVGDVVVLVGAGETPPADVADQAGGVIAEVSEGWVVVNWTDPTEGGDPADGDHGAQPTPGETPESPVTAVDGVSAPSTTEPAAGAAASTGPAETRRYADTDVPEPAAEVVAWIDGAEDAEDQIARARAAQAVENARKERRVTVDRAVGDVLD